MTEEQVSPSTDSVKIEHADNFVSIYANSAIFEATAWDLKIIFGQVDYASGMSGKPAIKQQVAVTIPWSQAKLAAYWLRLNVEAMEIQSGKIGLRPDVLPPEPPELTAEQAEVPNGKEIHELVKRLHAEFLASVE